MRKIKFKVWDEESKKMYCGYDAIVTFSGFLEEVYVRNKNTVDELIDYKIMQYTGLKDVNGIEIYEGDILSYKHITYTDCSKTKIEKIEDESFIEIITYAPIASIVKPHSKNVKCFGYDSVNKECLILDLTSDEVEIIGNIYENSELLEHGTCKCGYSITGANINEIQMSESARIDIKEVKDIENSKRKEYGKYKGYYKWDLTKAWFNMPNDAFYNKYGFNYHPHNDGNLYEECREFLSNNCVRINNYVDIKEIAANIEKHLKRNGVKEQSIINQFKNKAGL